MGDGKVEKLTISRCKVDGGKISTTGEKFVVMLNPTTFSHGRSISYNMGNPQGTSSAEPKYNRHEAETVNFDIVIDGTGVAEQPGATSVPDATKKIKNLKHIVYDYVGTNHQPSVVHLLWGTTTFYGRLKSMAVEYTLFKPNGDPVRAKVKLAFVSFMSKKEAARKENSSSPDLTHIVEVKAGDTLPLLCDRIYKDSSYYLDVARENNLVSFRDLQLGVRLHFPPLR